MFFNLELAFASAEPVILCDAGKGLELLNQETYLPAQIEMILNSCDKVSPSSPQVLLLHALFARKKEHYDEAISWFNKAIDLNPKNQSLILELASTYDTAKRYEEALHYYQIVLMKEPLNRAALLGKAGLLFKEGKYSQANATYQMLLLANSEDIDALNGLGRVKLAEKDLNSAKLYFEKSLKIDPNNIEAINALANLQKEPSHLNLLCNSMEGLILLNQAKPNNAEIEKILAQCALNQIDNSQTALLKGLLARKNKNDQVAIFWLDKAVHSSEKNDFTAKLELALTYEQQKNNDKAYTIYQGILLDDKSNKPALLGEARILRAQSKLEEATLIYKEILAKNAKDIDALNGLAWTELANANFNSALKLFEQSLQIEPQNEEAKTGIKQVAEAKLTGSLNQALPLLCEADEGLILLNQANPPIEKIKGILGKCDRNTPNNTSALVLHGLLERHFALKTGDYHLAIAYLQKATKTAEPSNHMPINELAVTYEWSHRPKDALAVYQKILDNNPNDRVALLGKARVLRSLYEIAPSVAIYQSMLKKAPKDPEALTGLGETFLTNYEFEKAKNLFNEALIIDPQNPQAKTDLMILNKATRNILAITGGHYSVPPKTADGINVFYFRNLNATDGLTILATHNNRQIESGFGVGPTLLPNNSLLVGYQHIIPNDHGWQLSYDARQHNALPFEHRLFGSTNWFLNQNLEWFGGMRWVFPRPWNTELLISGITAYTPTPFNVTLTGFWSFQQIDGYNSSYALDFSKEYDTHLFYGFGPSYLPEQKSWEIHGRVILPLFGNAALVAEGSHYFFNNSTFITAGWRFYWG